MESAGYTTLNRQVGLLREMQSVANNIANMATTGYRSEGVVFSEYVKSLGPEAPSLSMADGAVSRTDFSQGTLTLTGGPLDLAIEGPGFFQVATPDGARLTRAGHFTTTAEGLLVAPDGAAVLDIGGAPIALPLDGSAIGVGRDGTISVDGNPLAQIGLWQLSDPLDKPRSDGVRFAPEGAIDPVLEPVIAQGFLEESNVDPVREIARMVEVQRAYELGQSFLDRDDERVRGALRTILS